MGTPQSEHEFNGIIMLSYTSGEYSDMVDRANRAIDRMERRDERRGFRRGGPGILGNKSKEDWMDAPDEWTD